MFCFFNFSLSKQASSKTADSGGNFPENVPVTLTEDEGSKSTIGEKIGGTPTHMPEAEQSSSEEAYTALYQNYGGPPYATQPSKECMCGVCVCVCVCGGGGGGRGEGGGGRYTEVDWTGLTKKSEICQ